MSVASATSRVILVAFALFCSVTAATVLVADEPSFQHLEESLTCQCGCGLTVHSCNHLQCPSAIPLRQEIREQMALGHDEEQILAHFADKYGEKILSAPTMTGLNITAWIMPFIVVGLGMLFVSFTLLRWRRRTVDSAATTPGPAQPLVSTRSQETFERELEDFDV